MKNISTGNNSINKLKISDNGTSSEYFQLRPFLRWAGGKQKLVRFLLSFAPSKDAFNRYYEPFFGAGSLFFALQAPRAVLSDINTELMNCYREVAKQPKIVSNLLREYVDRDSSDFYYRIRDIPLEHMSTEEQAARFIYLNKAAFNGIYRVNKAGHFNVPYGPSFNGPAIPSEETLLSASKCMQNAEILSGDFEEVLANVSAGDFIYLDPPYPPLSKTAYFTHYSPQRFGWKEQERVARVFKDLSASGCLVMLSNADLHEVTSLYSGFYISKLSVMRWLGSNGDRFHVGEIVVTNYNPIEVNLH